MIIVEVLRALHFSLESTKKYTRTESMLKHLSESKVSVQVRLKLHYVNTSVSTESL